MAFIVALANGAFHLISLGFSIFTATVFRKISELPPDMNPLDDDNDSILTARPHKRNKSEMACKHLSSTTADSADPLMGTPRTIPFAHTRDDSQTTVASGEHNLYPPPRMSHIERQQANSEAARHDLDSAADGYTDYTYTYRSASPTGLRSRSPSTYSRTTTGTSTAATAYGDWLASRHGSRGARENPAAGHRGQYSTLSTQEENGYNDENYDYLEDRENTMRQDDGEIEGDLGDQLLGSHHREPANNRFSSSMNPLGMNPPTPEPRGRSSWLQMSGARQGSLVGSENRSALTDVHNFSHPNRANMPLIKNISHKGQGYEQIGDTSDIPAPLAASIYGDYNSSIQVNKRRSQSSKQRSAPRLSGTYTYGSEGEDDGISQGTAERDRRGRVVSNSGADLGGSGYAGTGSATPFSYGSYMNGMGVGRRRDVSGKLAEEGRGYKNNYYYEKDGAGLGFRQPSRGSVRAPGWARFAGY